MKADLSASEMAVVGWTGGAAAEEAAAANGDVVAGGKNEARPNGEDPKVPLIERK
mgnify:CR=1 FL=1